MGGLEHINILRRCYARDEAACWYQRLGALRVLEECDLRTSQERAPHFRCSSCVEFIVVSPFPYREQDLSSVFYILKTNLPFASGVRSHEVHPRLHAPLCHYSLLPISYLRAMWRPAMDWCNDLCGRYNLSNSEFMYDLSLDPSNLARIAANYLHDVGAILFQVLTKLLTRLLSMPSWRRWFSRRIIRWTKR